MRELTVSVAPVQVVLQEGRGAATATVTSAATSPRRVVLGVFSPRSGPGALPSADPGWATVERPLREVGPGATEEYVVSFVTPAGLAAGTYELAFVAYPADAAPEEYVDDAQIVRLVVLPATTTPPPPGKRRWPWVLAAVLLLVVIGVAVFLLTRPDPPPPLPPPPRQPASVVVATVPVGAFPSGVAIEPSTGSVYVTNRDSNTVSVLDPSPDGAALAQSIGVGASPIGVTGEPQGGRVFVANQGSGSISLIDIASGGAFAEVAVPGSPFGVAVHPDSRQVWVTLEDGRVAVVDPAALAVVRMITVGANPRGLAWNSSDASFYVANQGSDSVSVVDARTLTVTASVAVGENPSAVAVDPAAGTVYVANVLGDSVSVVKGGRVVDTIRVGTNPSAVGVDSEARALYVANSDGTVSVVDTGSGEVVETIQVGSTSTALVVDPESGTVYVANAGDGTVSVLQPGD